MLAGDLTPEQARALADAHFGSWRGDGVNPPPPGPPAPSAERVFVVDEPGAAQTSVVLAQPGVSYTDPDLPKLMVMNAVLGGSFSGRVNLNLRERHGYAYGAYSAVSPGRGVGLITVETNAETQFVGPAVRELLGEVAAIQNAPVTPEELELAKDSLSLSLPARFTTASDSVGAIGGLYLHDLPPDYYQKLPAELASIDAAGVQAVARTHLRPSEMKIIAVGDRAQIDPQLAELRWARSPTATRTERPPPRADGRSPPIRDNPGPLAAGQRPVRGRPPTRARRAGRCSRSRSRTEQTVTSPGCHARWRWPRRRNRALGSQTCRRAAAASPTRSPRCRSSSPLGEPDHTPAARPSEP